MGPYNKQEARPPIPLSINVPKEGTLLVVDLPGERIRSEVARVVNPDVIIVELTWQPLTKNHSYKLGDFVPVRKEDGMGGIPVWRAFVPTPKAVEVPKPRNRKTASRNRKQKKKVA